MKDLGVTFDPELNFNFHCEDNINKAYSVLGLIKRNFIYLIEDAFVSLYKSLVRCHLEYANSTLVDKGRLNTYKRSRCMRATKLVMTVKQLSYKDRKTCKTKVTPSYTYKYRYKRRQAT